MMKINPFLYLRVVPTKDADESFLKTLWLLRQNLIDLKPGVTSESDFASFYDFFKTPDNWVTLIQSRDGTIRGFLGWRIRSTKVGNDRFVIIDSDYYFIEPAIRGHVILTPTVMSCYIAGVWQFKSFNAVIVGHGYPASVLSGARFSERTRFLQDADVEPWEREAMLQFAQRYCRSSFDPESGLVDMRTKPRESRQEPRTRKGREIFARYEKYNPNWTEGVGLPYLIHLAPKSILAGGLQLTKR